MALRVEDFLTADTTAPAPTGRSLSVQDFFQPEQSPVPTPPVTPPAAGRPWQRRLVSALSPLPIPLPQTNREFLGQAIPQALVGGPFGGLQTAASAIFGSPGQEQAQAILGAGQEMGDLSQSGWQQIAGLVSPRLAASRPVMAATSLIGAVPEVIAGAVTPQALATGALLNPAIGAVARTPVGRFPLERLPGVQRASFTVQKALGRKFPVSTATMGPVPGSGRQAVMTQAARRSMLLKQNLEGNLRSAIQRGDVVAANRFRARLGLPPEAARPVAASVREATPTQPAPFAPALRAPVRPPVVVPVTPSASPLPQVAAAAVPVSPPVPAAAPGVPSPTAPMRVNVKNTRAVSNVFGRLVEQDRSTLEGVLANWSNVALSADGTRLSSHAGREPGTKNDAANVTYNVTKQSFLDWLYSEAPFDPKEFVQYSEWVADIQKLRALSGVSAQQPTIPAPTTVPIAPVQPTIPDFANTQEALAFGQQHQGNPQVIAALEAKRAGYVRLADNKALSDDIRLKAALAAQLPQEALEVAQGRASAATPTQGAPAVVKPSLGVDRVLSYEHGRPVVSAPAPSPAANPPSVVMDAYGKIARVIRWNGDKPVVVYAGNTGGTKPGPATAGGNRPYEYLLDDYKAATVADLNRAIRPRGGQANIDLRMWRALVAPSALQRPVRVQQELPGMAAPTVPTTALRPTTSQATGDLLADFQPSTESQPSLFSTPSARQDALTGLKMELSGLRSLPPDAATHQRIQMKQTQIAALEERLATGVAEGPSATLPSGGAPRGTSPAVQPAQGPMPAPVLAQTHPAIAQAAAAQGRALPDGHQSLPLELAVPPPFPHVTPPAGVRVIPITRAEADALQGIMVQFPDGHQGSATFQHVPDAEAASATGEQYFYKYDLPAGTATPYPATTPAPIQQTLTQQEMGRMERGGVSEGVSVPYNTPAFRAWFGDSKVVDAQGQPLVVYHQTTKAKEASILSDEGFSTDPKKARARLSDEQMPNGIFFKPSSHDIGVASADTKDLAQIAVYLSIKNPLVVENREDLKWFIIRNSEAYHAKTFELREINKKYDAQFESMWKSDEYLHHPKDNNPMDAILADWDAAIKAKAAEMRAIVDDVLAQHGYDGVIVEQDAGSFNRKTKTFVALRSTQIKSAIGNQGTYDPTNPSIVKEGAPADYNAEERAAIQGEATVKPQPLTPELRRRLASYGLTQADVFRLARALFRQTRTMQTESQRLQQAILEHGGIKMFAGRAESEEFRAVPLRLRRTTGLPLDEMAASLQAEGFPYEGSNDLLAAISEIKQLPTLTVKDFLPQAEETIFSNLDPKTRQALIEAKPLGQQMLRLRRAMRTDFGKAVTKLVADAQAKRLTPRQVSQLAKLYRYQPGQTVTGPKGGISPAPLSPADVRKVGAVVQTVQPPFVTGKHGQRVRPGGPNAPPPVIPRGRAIGFHQSQVPPIRDIPARWTRMTAEVDIQRAAQFADSGKQLGWVNTHIVQPNIEADARAVRRAEAQLAELQPLFKGIRKYSTEDARGQRALEHTLAEGEQATAQEQAAADALEAFYKHSIEEEINPLLVSLGRRPIATRQFYAPHIPALNFLDDLFGGFFQIPEVLLEHLPILRPVMETPVGERDPSLPPAMRDLPHIPNLPTPSFAHPRRGGPFQPSMIGGAHSYIRQWARLMEVSPSVQATKALVRYLPPNLRAMTAQWLGELQGQRPAADQGFDATALRRASTIARWTSRSFILGRISTFLVQYSSLGNTAARHGWFYTLRGYRRALTAEGRGFAERYSRELQQRMAVGTLIEETKTGRILNAPLEYADQQMVTTGFLTAVEDYSHLSASRFQQEIGQPKTWDHILNAANISVEQTQASMRRGLQPAQIRSRMLRATVSQLQTFNLNLRQQQFIDPRLVDLAHGGTGSPLSRRAVWEMAKLDGNLLLMNGVYKLLGLRAPNDPSDFVPNFDPFTGMVPVGPIAKGFYSGGRFVPPAVFLAVLVTKMVKDLQEHGFFSRSVQRDLLRAAMMFVPMGGQISATTGGVVDVLRGGRPNTKDPTRFDYRMQGVTDQLMAVTVGSTATAAYRAYRARGFTPVPLTPAERQARKAEQRFQRRHRTVVE